VTLLLDVLALPCKPASNSLLPAAVARLVNAATVEATLVVEPGVELEVLPALALLGAAAAAALVAEGALEEFKRLERAEAWLLETPLIDIMTSLARNAGIRGIGGDSKNLSADSGAPHQLSRRSVVITISRGTPKRMGSQWPNPAETSRYELRAS
jgi:hypothetical protein